MTWPRELGHISRTKGRRPLKFSDNLTKGLKCSYSKNQISSFKNGGYRAQNLPGGGIHPPHVRARVKNRVKNIKRYKCVFFVTCQSASSNECRQLNNQWASKVCTHVWRNIYPLRLVTARLGEWYFRTKIRFWHIISERAGRHSRYIQTNIRAAPNLPVLSPPQRTTPEAWAPSPSTPAWEARSDTSWEASTGTPPS